MNHSSRIPTPQNGYTTGNYPRYSNTQWDNLIDRYASTIPAAERKQALTDVFAFLLDNLHSMQIIYGVNVQFSSKRLIVPDENPIWVAETWDLR